MAQFSLKGQDVSRGEPGKHPLPISFHLCSAPAKHHSPHPPHGLSFIGGVFKSKTVAYPVRSLKAGWSCSESESLLTIMASEWKRVSVFRMCSKVAFLWHSLLTCSPCQLGAEISSFCRSNYWISSKQPWKTVKTKQQPKYKAEGDVV